MNYLHSNYAKDISLQDIAKDIHLSRNYLATVFKQETGKTIGEALTIIRLERSKLLLAEGRLSINEIAKEIGYHSSEHFCRIFRRYEKIAPSRYGK